MQHNTRLMEMIHINAELALHDIKNREKKTNSKLNDDQILDVLLGYFKDPDDAEYAFELIQEECKKEGEHKHG